MPGRLPASVLHVLNGASGGASLTTRSLIRHLDDLGVRSSAVCDTGGAQADWEDLVEATTGRAIRVPLRWWNRKLRVPALRRPLVSLGQQVRTGLGRRSAASVTEFARETGAELVHTNTLLTPEGSIAARALGLPHVWHARELVGPGQPFRFPRETTFFRRHVVPGASVLVANSSVTAAALQPFVGNADIAVVPNGIEVDELLRVEEPPHRDRCVVGLVAHLSSRTKRHDLFIDAAARIPADASVELWLIGQDPGDAYAAHLRRLTTRAGLGNRVRFAGAMTPTDAMASIDLLVHTAPDESFGRTIVEAMAAARPVVAVDGGGAATLVRHGESGILVPPDDADALAARITELALDADRRRAMGARGRELAGEHSAARMAQSMLAVYERAMDRPLR